MPTIGVNTEEIRKLQINLVQAVILQTKLQFPNCSNKELSEWWGISTSLLSKETTALIVAGYLTQDGTITTQYQEALHDPDNILTDFDEVAASLKDFVNLITGGDQKLLKAERDLVKNCMLSSAFKGKVREWRKAGKNVPEAKVKHFQMIAFANACFMRRNDNWKDYAQITTFLRSVNRYEQNAAKAKNFLSSKEGRKAYTQFLATKKFDYGH